MSTCYANPNPTFLPAMRLISSITNDYPALVTTTFNHGYTTGLIVRLHIPTICGMQEIKDLPLTITVTDVDTFTVDVDTTRFGAFAIPVVPVPVWADTCAQVIPIGEDNSMLTEATRNVLP
jgi:hypothetical protein